MLVQLNRLQQSWEIIGVVVSIPDSFTEGDKVKPQII
jgi:hypothetical protein